MKKVFLLDCTLRDGGYVNNWHFGKECISECADVLVKSSVDIVELGMIRMGNNDSNRSVFSEMDGFKYILPYKGNAIFSAMIEGNEPELNFPTGKLLTAKESGIDLIRVCTWKRLMKEHIDYCKEIAKLGYRISIQPTAIDQYSDDEFIALCKLANSFDPFSLYLVDTWGTQTSKQIVHYAKLADIYLKKDIKLGYHGHNNKMQAINCVEALISLNLDRDLCFDSSIMGMGRGPGNLQTEILMDYLNKAGLDKKYDIGGPLHLYSKYISSFYKQFGWGYSIYHFISANNSLPQDFATYFKENGYSIEEFSLFINSLSDKEKVVFNKEFAEKRLKELNVNLYGG